METYSAIPGFDEVSLAEFKQYCDELAPDAVLSSAAAEEATWNIGVFWSSVAQEVPALAHLAQRYMRAVNNSADAERSFSLYNLVCTDRRRALSKVTLKALVMLYHKLGVECGAFEK